MSREFEGASFRIHAAHVKVERNSAHLG